MHYPFYTLYFVSVRILNSIKSLLILIEFVKINVVRTHPLTPRFTGSKINYFVSTCHLLIKLISLWRHSSSSQNPRWRDVHVLNLDWLIYSIDSPSCIPFLYMLNQVKVQVHFFHHLCIFCPITSHFWMPDVKLFFWIFSHVNCMCRGCDASA